MGRQKDKTALFLCLKKKKVPLFSIWARARESYANTGENGFPIVTENKILFILG